MIVSKFVYDLLYFSIFAIESKEKQKYYHVTYLN